MTSAIGRQTRMDTEARLAERMDTEARLNDATVHRPTPNAHAAVPAGYSGTPLVKKLGIGAGARVALVGAPPGIEALLVDLPAGVTVHTDARSRADVSLWFVGSKRELARGIARMAPRAEKCGLWIAWPKKSSGVATDLTEDAVRGAGLATGIVDIKVCAIDAIWSGLRFSTRKSKPLAAKKRAPARKRPARKKPAPKKNGR